MLFKQNSNVVVSKITKIGKIQRNSSNMQRLIFIFAWMSHDRWLIFMTHFRKKMQLPLILCQIVVASTKPKTVDLNTTTKIWFIVKDALRKSVSFRFKITFQGFRDQNQSVRFQTVWSPIGPGPKKKKKFSDKFGPSPSCPQIPDTFYRSSTVLVTPYYRKI